MSDMPETIWAWYFLPNKRNNVLQGGWDYHEDRKLDAYRRADLPVTDAQALANPKVQVLVEALEPYSQLAKHHAADAPEWGPFDSVTAQVSIRNLRDARAALAALDVDT